MFSDLKEYHSEYGLLIKDNKPIPFYHGTNTKFDLFDKSFLGTAKNGSVYGDSFNFTSNKLYAERFGKYIVSAYLNIKNPLIINPNSYLIDSNILNKSSDLSNKPVMLKMLRKLWIGDSDNSSQDGYLLSKLKSPFGFIDLLKGIAHGKDVKLSDLIRKFGFDSIVDGHIIAVFDVKQITIIDIKEVIDPDKDIKELFREIICG